MAKEQNLFSPIKNKRHFEEVSSGIKDLIFNETLKVGDKLPSEAQLAQQFNVGRQTIREALRLLELSGFITIQRGGGGGSTIKNTVLSRISDLFIDAFRLRKITLEHLTQARLAVERIILEQAMINADQKELNDLKDNLKAARKALARGRMATEENTQFHILLAKATRNEVFVIVTESIMAVHLDLLSGIGATLETSEKGIQAHEKILQAVSDKDHDRAQRIMEEHVLEVQARLEDTPTLPVVEPVGNDLT